jgi:2-oxoglutarate/2-oxoacid ferredoxin oxidoreductase subunit beta
MVLPDDESERVLQEECPGPPDLESVLTEETLSSAISRPPLIMDAGTSLAEVLRCMRDADRGAVLVVTQGKLVGIFTERDVLLRVAGHAINLERAVVGELMTPDPVTLPADASVAFGLNKMLVEGFRHIPLVDDEGKPTAVVSMRDLIEYMSSFFKRDVLNLPPDPRPSFRNPDGA